MVRCPLVEEGETPPVFEARGVNKLFPVIRSSFEGIRFLIHMARGNVDFVSEIDHVEALSDVSFTIRRGERVGLIGRNGSGKSTLLNLIASGSPATSGSLRVNGQAYCLSAGNVRFDEEQSARENARAFFRDYEVPETEIPERLRELEAFLELGPYFDQPFKFSSMGMRARTEFAAATAVDASIILIDEVLTAGDMYWAERCAQRLELFCGSGRSVLLVSHSMAQVLRYCERVIWIDKGRLVMDGPAHDVVRRYEAYLEALAWSSDDVEDKTFDSETHAMSYSDTVLEDSANSVMRWPGRGDLSFSGLWVNGATDTVVTVNREAPLRVRFTIKAHAAGDYTLRYILTFWSPTGKRLGVAENDRDRVAIEEGMKREVSLEVPGGILGPGTYYLSLTLVELASGDSSGDELGARHDVIYKSIRLSVHAGSDADIDGTLPVPVFSIPLDATNVRSHSNA